MKPIRMSLTVVALGAVLLVGLPSCQQAKEADFGNVREVAELSTLDCYYHTVAQFNREADGGIFKLLNIGYKKMWFEYDSWVKVGIDASKVSIEPRGDNAVVIKVPKAEVQGDPRIDESSMTVPVTEAGPFTQFTNEDRKKALSDSVENTLNQVRQDDALLAQARDRAKTILKEYVLNVGKAVGKAYTVEFEDVG